VTLDIAVVTTDCYEDPAELSWYNLQVMLEDEYVVAALERQGLTARRISWLNSEFDWNTCRGLVIRSTWGYPDRMTDFEAWLSNCSRQLCMFNAYSTVTWNLDKRYLLDLRQRGIRIVETILFPQSTNVSLRDEMAAHDWDDAILKPVVSAGARHTYRILDSNVDEIQRTLDPLIADEAFLLQPFQQSVLDSGELSLMVMGGVYTHAVRKTPQTGDFRVQDEFGGHVVPYTANQDEIAFAEAAVAACDPQPVYARVDVVRDHADAIALMELELVEPELFFRFNPSAADPLAESIAHAL